MLGEAEVRERLQVFLERELGTGPGAVRIAMLGRLPGGASRETWAVEALVERKGGGTGRLDLVMRRDPPGRAGEGDRRLEFCVLRAAAGAGVPVPRVHFLCSDPDVLETPFFLMDRIEGETLPRRLLRDERYADTRRVLLPQLAEALAAVHRIPLDHPDLADLPASPKNVSPAEAQLDGVARALRELAVEPHPVLDVAERWLRERLPAGSRTALVHGDYRIGNVVFGEEGLRAVLDWELVHAGDPVEDLGWLCTRAWRHGGRLPAGGLGTREELLAAYKAAGGAEVDPAHLRFFEALGSFKVALVFIQQASVFLSGKLPSVELASLGRRTAEAEEELLRLMDGEA